jgi:transposase
MNYVGIDLHKKSISICVVVLAGRKRRVTSRANFFCAETDKIREFFAQLEPFEAVVEATASYEWFVQLIETRAQRVVLAHPKKLRVIAESKRKTDKIDAFVLAEFLALDMIPEAYRPTRRQRQHRSLVRYRCYVQRRSVSVRNKIRHILANYNADVRGLFSVEGLAYLKQQTLSPADQWVLEALLEEWQQHRQRLRQIDRQLAEFAAAAPAAEQEARRVLESFPGAGPVTTDVVLAELGDPRRLRSLRRAGSFAGLAPGFRESAKRRKEQGITKEGPRLLRWAMIQLAWRVVQRTARWRNVFEKLEHRIGKKKAITAVARRVFCVLVSMLRAGQAYRWLEEPAGTASPRSQKPKATRTTTTADCC